MVMVMLGVMLMSMPEVRYETAMPSLLVQLEGTPAVGPNPKRTSLGLTLVTFAGFPPEYSVQHWPISSRWR